MKCMVTLYPKHSMNGNSSFHNYCITSYRASFFSLKSIKGPLSYIAKMQNESLRNRQITSFRVDQPSCRKVL